MPNSHSSPHCSTPVNDSLESVIKNDIVRYKRKGYGLFFACLLTFLYIFYLPELLRLIWPYILKNLGITYFFLITVIGIHSGLNAVIHTVMYLIYKAKIPFFERYKINDKPWPWESDPELWKNMLKRTLKFLAISHVIIIPGFALMETQLGLKQRFDLESFPSTMEIVGQLVFFMLSDDFMFYWNHRFLHLKSIYPYIHKIHHEYNLTVSIASEYVHPIEFIVGNVLPPALGPKLLGSRVHFVTYILWVVIRILEAADGHSGYEFSWSPFRLLPLSSSSIYHSFHHSHNVGNYGSFFTFWDTLCGTNKHYFRYLANKERKELTQTKQS